MYRENVSARVQDTELGQRVLYYTDMKLDDVMRRVKVTGELERKYALPESITVIPESIIILTKEEGELKETPHGELPSKIDSYAQEINGYMILREG